MKTDNNLVRLDPEKLAGLGLEEFAPYPDDIVLSGQSKHQRWPFSHGELFVGAYQAEPAKLTLEDYPYDEFMYLLSGKLSITDEDGNLEDKYRSEQGFTLEAYRHQDSQEARDAFNQKRDAEFD